MKGATFVSIDSEFYDATTQKSGELIRNLASLSVSRITTFSRLSYALGHVQCTPVSSRL